MNIKTKREIANGLEISKGIAAVTIAVCGLALLFLKGSIRKDEDEIKKERDRQREERRAERMAERQQNRERERGEIRKEDRL